MVRVCMVKKDADMQGRKGREGVRKKGEEGEHFHHHWSCQVIS